MNGYLLDNNAVHLWFCQNANIMANVARVGTSPIEISVITLGETNFGHNLNTPTDAKKRADCIDWIGRQFQYPLPVTRHTCTYYGELKAVLAKTCGIPRAKRPVNWFDKVTGDVIGIDDNDLWIAAQALEHNLVLVSADRMKRIRDAAGNLLNVENWEAA